MRGGFLHNHVLLDPIEEHFRLLGANTRREHAAGRGRTAGYVDLFVEFGFHRIACEAELTADRVGRDVTKAESTDSTLLMIVVPRRRVARLILSALERSVLVPAFPVWVLPLGPMVQRVRARFPLNSTMNVRRKSEDKRPERASGERP